MEKIHTQTPDAATGKTAMRFKYITGEDVKKMLTDVENFKFVVSDDTVIMTDGRGFLHCSPDPDSKTGSTYKNNFRYDIDWSLIREKKYDEIARIIRRGIYKPIYNIVGLRHTLTTDHLKFMLDGDTDRCNITADILLDNGKYTCSHFGYIYMDEAGMFVFKVNKTNCEYELGEYWTIPADMDNPDDFLKDIVKYINTAVCEVASLKHPVKLDKYEIIELHKYIYRAWCCLRYNFEKTDMYGDTWYSCNEDEYGNELPIWQWYIGNKDRDVKVEIGFVRNNYAHLFQEGNLIEEMVEVLDDIMIK